jgi:hypothetical protein
MVIRLFSLITLMLFVSTGCRKELHELSMAKTPYIGNELRIDGYYYSNLTLANDIGVGLCRRKRVAGYYVDKVAAFSKQTRHR